MNAVLELSLDSLVNLRGLLPVGSASKEAQVRDNRRRSSRDTRQAVHENARMALQQVMDSLTDGK